MGKSRMADAGWTKPRYAPTVFHMSYDMGRYPKDYGFYTTATAPRAYAQVIFSWVHRQTTWPTRHPKDVWREGR